MGSLTTEVPVSATSQHSGADTLESEAIGLDVSVRVHGSQVTAVVLDTTEHVEPFEEDTSTMIVFPRGAVVKLRARVRTGHAVVLTNLSTQQTALGRVIQVNSTANAVNYVKLEFSQPEPGFWGVHFPSDDVAPAAAENKPHSTNGAAAPAVPPAKPHEAPKTFGGEQLAGKAQLSSVVDLPQQEPGPPVRETPRNIARVAPNYGASSDAQANSEVVPLAAAPAKSGAAAPKPQVTLAPLNPATAAEPLIFDSLSTGEEVFGKDEHDAAGKESILLKADARGAQAFGRSLDPSLLQSVAIPKRHTGLKIFLSVAAVIIIGAGTAFYVKQYRGNARENAAVTETPSIYQPVPSAGSNIPAQEASPQTSAPIETQAISTPSTPPKAAQGSAPAVQPPAQQNGITVTPVHAASRNPASQNNPTISTGLANVYAGDLTARPQASQRTRVPVQAPAPAIGGVPGNLGATSSSVALGSLVGGSSSDNSALPKPAEPKSLARGGVVTQPRLIHTVQPLYPSLAASNRIEGEVQIEASIDRTGKVIATKVISGPVLLRRAAMDAVKQWRYSPALLDGKPIAMQYKVKVRFRLGQ